MISNVVVTYTVKPEAFDEHVGLIDAVFAQLDAEAPSNLEYKVLCLDDGVSFVHVSTADTPDGSNPLPQLAAFQQFAHGLGDRVATPPGPSAARLIGSYHPGSTQH
jgi:hypothetical protein